MDQVLTWAWNSGNVPIALLVVFIGALYTGRIVWASECKKEIAAVKDRLADRDRDLQEMTSDRNEWKGMALTLLGQSAKAIDLAHKSRGVLE